MNITTLVVPIVVPKVVPSSKNSTTFFTVSIYFQKDNLITCLEEGQKVVFKDNFRKNIL
jgi:hypothetical protein